MLRIIPDELTKANQRFFARADRRITQREVRRVAGDTVVLGTQFDAERVYLCLVQVLEHLLGVIDPAGCTIGIACKFPDSKCERDNDENCGHEGDEHLGFET